MWFAGWRDRQANLDWLASLRQLEQLSLEGVGSDDLTRLAGLTRLRSLTLDFDDCQDDESETEKRLAAISKLRQLRRVRLEGFSAAHVARLGGLTNLKSLTLDFYAVDDDREQMREDQERVHECFVALGKLTQLEQLELRGVEDLPILGEDLACLRGLTNLESLRLHMPWTDESESHSCLAALAKLTHLRRLWLEGELVSAGLAELSPLESLEELTTHSSMVTPAVLESLTALKHLKAIHLEGLVFDLHSTTEEAAEVRRALEALRRSHPEIIVDADGNSPWMKAQKEDFPWWGWEHFDAARTDLDWFLGLYPIVGF